MAKFQHTTPREDKTTRRPLTKDDLEFLAALQTELNTQDTMGNQDPRFWVIRQTRQVLSDKDSADRTVFINEDGSTVAADIPAFLNYIKMTHPELKLTWEHCKPAGCLVELILPATTGAGGTEVRTHVAGTDSVLELINGALNHEEYGIAYEKDESANVQDTLFLTHRACEEHLRKYGYNYEPDAHAYAMTAVRSPQFERLIQILQQADWTEYLKDAKE